MNRNELIATILTLIIGPGSLGMAWMTRDRKRKGRGDPIPTAELRETEITKAAESIDLDARWRGYVDEMRTYFGAEINSLKRDRERDRERIAALERRDVAYLAYVMTLRTHIELGKPPPAPPWPKAIDPTA